MSYLKFEEHKFYRYVYDRDLTSNGITCCVINDVINKNHSYEESCIGMSNVTNIS